jgi:uncharacterized protein (TIGR03790 family)
MNGSVLNRWRNAALHIPARLMCVALVGFLLLQVFQSTGLGGGGPQNVLVVVNDQSLESLELGRHYRELRGIPEINICHVSVPPCVQGIPASYSISESNFISGIRAPVLQYISSMRLTNQIDYIVFSRDIPYKVNDSNGTTSAMFYGYKPSPAAPMSPNTENFYYMAERGFSRRENTNDYYLSMMLTSYTLDDAKALAARGAASDGVSPTGAVYLVKTADPLRNIRYLQFNATEFSARFMANGVSVTNMNAASISGRTDVVAYLTGLTAVPDLQSNTFLPGSFGDHMTSYGGQIFDSSQMSILEFIRAGACASYGTVVEPYDIAEKFPAPMSCFWHMRGFNLAESYWMSVKNPYNGLFVGEPLACPYAVRPVVSITAPATNAVVSGAIFINAQATSVQSDKPVSRLDLFVDGLFAGTMTNILPQAGNVVKATIGGTAAAYSVRTNDTLYDVAAGLASNITASNGMPVDASAYGDRIQLVYTNYGQQVGNLAYAINCLTGTASALSLSGTALTTNLLESVYPARELFPCYLNPPDPGDILRLTVTLQDGTVTTNEIVAATNDTADAMMTRLYNAVNSNSVLQATNGVFATDYLLTSQAEFWLQAMQPGPQGYNIKVKFDIVSAWPSSGLRNTTAFTDNMNDNIDVLTARGNILLACGATNLNAQYALQTGLLPDGPHTLRVVAYEGTALRTQGYSEIPVVVSNSTFACDLVSPTNGQAFVLGDTVSSTATVSGAVGTVTQAVLLVEGKPVASSTNAPFVFSWPTLTYGVGTVGVQFVAWDSSNSVALSPTAHITLRATNDADRDGLPDSWERSYFGGIYAFSGTDDADGDGANNLNEYIADTNPTNPASYFRILGFITDPASGNVDISFVSSTGRLYRVDIDDTALTDTNGWTVPTDPLFQGSAGQYTWIDAGSTNRPHPSLVTNRFYRIRAHLP